MTDDAHIFTPVTDTSSKLKQTHSGQLRLCDGSSGKLLLVIIVDEPTL